MWNLLKSNEVNSIENFSEKEVSGTVCVSDTGTRIKST